MIQSQSGQKINYKLFFFLTIILFTLGQITSDIYTPSMPAIMRFFHSTSSTIQVTMAIYMLGFSISQLIYGILSDSFGRRGTILAGLMVGTLGSLICFAAMSPAMLILGRFVQGFGLGVTSTLGRAISRDVFSGEQLAKIGSYLGAGSALMVAFAPVVGGYIQHYFDWRWVFIFVFIYSCIILCAIWMFLPETFVYEYRKPIRTRIILENLKLILSSRVFLGYGICSCCAYAGLLGYFTIAPFLLQNILGLTPVHYGFVTACMPLAILVGGIINGVSLSRLGIHKLMIIGICMMLLGGGGLLLLSLVQLLNIFLILVCVILFALGAEFMFANSFSGAVTPFPKIAGTAAAVYGGLQIGGGFASSATISFFGLQSQLSLAIVFVILGMIALFAYIGLAISKPKAGRSFMLERNSDLE